MLKILSHRPVALLALAGLLYGCQQEELEPVSAPIKLESQSLVMAENCDVIDFENAGTFPRDENGFITGVKSQKGANINVIGFARYTQFPADQWLTTNRANIFDTSNPGVWDDDLLTPGFNNTTSLGNVLVVQELRGPDNDVTQPNDNAHGEQMVFDFSTVGQGKGVTIKSMHVLDIEPHEEYLSRVDFYDAAGTKINTTDIKITPSGNNGVALMTFEAMRGVMKMVVTMDGKWNAYTNAGSGAIDNIEFCIETPPCGPCEGKVNSLTFQYQGPDNAKLIATAKVGAFYLPILLLQDLDDGETFTLDGAKNMDKRGGFAGTLGTEVVLVQTVNGRTTTTMIHTSCSQPIYERYEGGMYTTLAGSSKIGGDLCAFAPPVAEVKEACSRYTCHHKCDKNCVDQKGKKKCAHKCSSKNDQKDDHITKGWNDRNDWWKW
jgi:hypothetical protein